VPALTIHDQDGTQLFTTDLQGEGLGRYFKAAASLRSVAPVARALSQPLTAAAGARSADFTLDRDIPVGAGELSIGGGTTVAIGIHKSGSSLFDGSDLHAAVTVPNGTS
jgi:hypothetical protein